MATVYRVLLALCFLELTHSFTYERAFNELEEWERFKNKYVKTFDSQENEEYRRTIFLNNLKQIYQHYLKHESGNVSYSMAVNQFSDLDLSEVPRGLGSPKWVANSFASGEFYKPPPNLKVPKEVDCRKKGLVTHVKDQGTFGSCWAFSAIGALEGQYAKKFNKLVSLSEQNFIDCDKDDTNTPGGGTPWTAYTWLSKHKGINPEKSYPYEMKAGPCRFNKSLLSVSDTGYLKVKRDEESLKIAVAEKGPISISIHVDEAFQHYESGVFHSPKCSSDSTKADHSVLVVGYGTTEKGEDYWIVKNSYGEGWGEKGYIRIKRHVNICGIANFAVFPLVK